LRVVERLLKARDRNLAELVEHRQLCRRDRSPDSAQRLQGGKVILDAGEFFERLNYLHEHWRKEIQEGLEALYGLRPRRDEAAAEPGQTQAPAGQTQTDPGQPAAAGDSRPAGPPDEVEASGDGDLPGGAVAVGDRPCGDAAGSDPPGGDRAGLGATPPPGPR